MDVTITLAPNARVLMTRDMELIRKILLEIQSRKDLEPREVKIEGYNDVILGRHIELLFTAGIIEGLESRQISNTSRIVVTDMSWAGHDFIGAIENKSVWNKITQSFSATEVARMPLSVLADVAIELLKGWAKKQVGLAD
jgi:hypothetical protein